MKTEDVMLSLERYAFDLGTTRKCDALVLIEKARALFREKDAEIERLQGAVKQYEEERKYHFEMSRKRIAETIDDFVERMKGFIVQNICVVDDGTDAIYKALNQISNELKKEDK